MKLEQSKNTFKPITITLETKDEADYLWHLLNSAKPFIEYGRKKEALLLYERFGFEMFEVFNEVHKVK